MVQFKMLVVGGLLGVVSMVNAAKADCHLDSNTYQLDMSHEAAESTCSTWVETALDCSELSPEACDDAMGTMYEACVVIALHTGAVK